MNDSKDKEKIETIYKDELPAKNENREQEEKLILERKRLLQEWLKRAKDIKSAGQDTEKQDNVNSEQNELNSSTHPKKFNGRFVEKETETGNVEENGRDSVGNKTIISSEAGFNLDADYMVQQLGNMRFMSFREEIKIRNFRKKRMNLKIDVSKDKMTASLLFVGNEREDVRNLTEAEIKEELYKRGIVFGLDPRIIRLAAEYPVYNQGFIVAKGIQPTKGEDGYVKWIVKECKDHKPKVLADGSVDYRSIGYTTSVPGGTVLCELVQPKEGVAGTDIYGKSVSALEGDDAKVKLGENVEMVGNKIISKCGGIFSPRGNVVSIIDKFSIPDGVNFKTGNIETHGSLIIDGGISPGFTVKADGDVVVNGPVDDAVVIAGRDIEISSGIRGSKTAIIAGENISINFAENVTIKAGGSINANYMINCYVTCGGDLNLSGKKSVLMTGIVMARGDIRAVDIGTKSNAKTVINLKKHGLYSKEMNELRRQKEKLEMMKKEREVMAESFKKISPVIINSMSPDKKRYYEQASHELDEIDDMLDEVNDKIKKTNEEEKAKGQYISVSGTIYVGTVIEVEDEEYSIKNDIHAAVISYRDGIIKIEGK